MAVVIYLVIGCPGSGKSWVCEQLTEQYEYVRHDDYIDKSYVDAIHQRYAKATKPLLIETPFSVSQVKEPLEKLGLHVTPVFILDDPRVISERYLKRVGHPIPAGHLSRQKTYRERAEAWQSYRGTSDEVLAYLKALNPVKFQWQT